MSAHVTPPPLEHAVRVIDIQFSESLDEAGVFGDGWGEPEAGFAWTIGHTSGMTLSAPGGAPLGAGSYELILQGHPYLHPPALKQQRLRVSVNGAELAHYVLDGLFTKSINIPASAMADGGANIVFHCPDSASPARHGAADSRILGIRFWRIALFWISAPQGAGLHLSPAPAAQTAGAAQQLAALIHHARLSAAENALAARLSDTTDIVEQAAANLVFRKLFAECVTRGYMIAASHMASKAAGNAAIIIEFDGAAGTDISVMRFTKTTARMCVFGVSPILRTMPAVGAEMIMLRLLAVLPMFARVAASKSPAGSCMVNLGDEGHVHGVAFCNVPSMDMLLIPDPYFLATGGYADLRDAANDSVPWAERRNTALWRGATTGYRTDANFTKLPRVALCTAGAQPENRDYIDAGFTELTNGLSHNEKATLQHLGLISDFVPPADFQQWKYHIDIDGNTNSWPGLLQKLLSGSAVLKITSTGPYRQWYYDQLKPFENFVPVAPDMGDLIEKIAWLRANDHLARAIGACGRDLGLSLTYDSQVSAGVCAIQTALLID